MFTSFKRVIPGQLTWLPSVFKKSRDIRQVSTITQFCTDIEGHADYLRRQINQSELVTFDKHGEIVFKSSTTSKAEPHFIYGGDICDRGNDLWCIERLTRFKNKYPHNVTLLAGNRDINKLRFRYELPSDPTVSLGENLDIPTPDFANKSYRQFLIDTYANENLQHDVERLNTPITRLQWMLAHTMNAPKAFEHRRSELASRLNKSIDDIDVYMSFYQSAQNTGVMWDYLVLTQLMDVIGDTVYVHGGISEANFGAVPKRYDNRNAVSYRYHNNISEWCLALNTWYREQLDLVQSDLTPAPLLYSRHTKAAPLLEMACHTGSRFKNKSIIVANMTKRIERGHVVPTYITDKLATQLTQQSIHRIVSGHQPNGDTPCYVQGIQSGYSTTGNENIEYIIADTLHGGSAKYIGFTSSTGSTRGRSFATLYIDYAPGVSSHARVSGTDARGNEYHLTLQNRIPGTKMNLHDVGRLIHMSDKTCLIRVNTIGCQPAASVFTANYGIECQTLESMQNESTLPYRFNP